MVAFRRVVEDALEKGATYADVRFQEERSTSVEVKDGELRKAVPGRERGASVRVLLDGTWGLATAPSVDAKGLNRALEEAVSMARALAPRVHERVTLAPTKPVRDVVRWRPKKDATKVALEAKRDLLLEASKAATSVPGIASAKLALDDEVVTSRIVTSDGTDITMEIPRLLLQIDLVARGDHGKVVGYRARIGGTKGFEAFDAEDPSEKAEEAARSALRILTAKAAPSGRLDVIADPDLAGVFAHEAIGHACEADLVIAGESLLEGRLGEKLGSDLVTIVDDGRVKGGYGSMPYDDEGVKASRKVLLEKGVLKGYILSRETAGRLGMKPNGGARAASHAARPLVRMSNTLIEKGDRTFEDLIEGVKRGVYAKGTRGGQVDTAKGTFQFGAQEAWLIEDGELTTPLRDVALQGEILETLRTIDAVGKDAKLASPGICGKGQLVPVGDGGPHVRIRHAVVGGGA